jgi:hypothetical protein
MAGDRKSARHERAAVAYAHRLVTNAGFMWREMTGQDIGIDGAVELPYDDRREYSPRGYALVQVKSRTGAIRASRLTVAYKKRHHLYWLTQRLPMVLCIAQPEDHDQLSRSIRGYWVDYKSLEHPELSISRSHHDRRWMLKVELDSQCVWPQQGKTFADWESEAESFHEWLENVLVNPAEAIAKTLESGALDLLGSGRPDRAQNYLRQLPLWERVLLKEGSRTSVEKTIAKTYRRLGAIQEQTMSVQNYRAGGKPVPDFMKTELALTYWTRACITKLPRVDVANWRRAIKTLGLPAYRGSRTFNELKGRIVRLGALVNITSCRSSLPGRTTRPPGRATCNALRRVIGIWTHSKTAKQQDPRFFPVLFNALRALCRGHLSRGELAEAETVLEKLRDHMQGEPERETLALTDFLLLACWISIDRGDAQRASAILECTGLLLKAMYDPLLAWFRTLMVLKAQTRAPAVGRPG